MTQVAPPSTSLYDALGGDACVRRVHRIFYDKIYAHPWLSKFFSDTNQADIENQQTDFIASAMGGPNVYCGKFPITAHKHMFIPDDLFELRHQMLKESLAEAGIPGPLAEKWLKIDASFRKGIVKQSVDECEKRFVTDVIFSYDEPKL